MAINFELSSLDTGELYKALAKAQAEFTPCAKNADNPFYKSKYALYEDLLRASRPALAEQGLCAISKVLHIDGDVYSVIELHHGASQQFTRCWQKLEPIKRDIAGFSGAHSYWRRVMFRDLLGIICSDEDDDDGNHADDNTISDSKNATNNNNVAKKPDGQSATNNTNVAKKPDNQGVISADQLAQLNDLLDDDEAINFTLKMYKVDNLAQLKQHDFPTIIELWQKK